MKPENIVFQMEYATSKNLIKKGNKDSFSPNRQTRNPESVTNKNMYEVKKHPNTGDHYQLP